MHPAQRPRHKYQFSNIFRVHKDKKFKATCHIERRSRTSDPFQDQMGSPMPSTPQKNIKKNKKCSLHECGHRQHGPFTVLMTGRTADAAYNRSELERMAAHQSMVQT